MLRVGGQSSGATFNQQPSKLSADNLMVILHHARQHCSIALARRQVGQQVVVSTSRASGGRGPV